MQACKAAIGHPSALPYTTKVMITGSPLPRLELHFLDVAHPEFKSLADQFTAKWLHAKPKKGVKVMDVIKIEVCTCNSRRHVGIAGMREGGAAVGLMRLVVLVVYLCSILLTGKATDECGGSYAHMWMPARFVFTFHV